MSATPPQLSDRQLNRAVLARQLLLQRADIGIVDAVERVAGLQTQYVPSGYVGLWNRLVDLHRAALTDALEQGAVVQGTLMRMTIHMVSAGDYWPFAVGVRAARRNWWLGIARQRKLPAVDYDRLAEVLRHELRGGPRRRNELVEAVAAAGFDKAHWEAAGLWLDMVRMPPSGTWERRRADLYGLARGWVRGRQPSEARGMEQLLRRYFAAFGPAPIASAASWAGIKAPALQPVVERMDLRRFVDDRGRELLDVPDGVLPDADTPSPVRLLPTWEAVLLVHARHSSALPEEYRPLIFAARNPQSVGSVLVDGAVAGTWRWTGDAVAVDTFRPLKNAVRRELDGEVESLTAFHRS